MSPKELKARRPLLNERMMEAETLFRRFGAPDGEVYAEGAIGRKHEESMAPGISVATRRDERVLYRLDGSRSEGASREEIVEAIEIGVVAGGSITFPDSRFACAALEEHEEGS